jgi:hypothetical protein
MTAKQAYDICLYLMKKNSQNGNLTATDFNNIINVASEGFQAYLVGEFQQYQYNKGVPRVSWGQNQNVRERLTPTIYNYNLSINGAGLAQYPGDYLQTDAMWNIYGTSRIRFVPQEKLWSTLDSVIDPIATNPIFLVEDVGFRFYPVTQGSAKLSYVRKAPRIVYAYTLDGNGRPVYDAANSVDPIWSELDCAEIIARAMRMVGVNLSANEISSYANEIIKNGQ